MSTTASPQSNSHLVHGAADDSAEEKERRQRSVRPRKQTTEQPADGSPSAPWSALSPQHKSRLRSDAEEIPPPETALILTSESDGEGDVSTGKLTAAERASAASVTYSVQVAAATSVGSPGSALHRGGAAAALPIDVAESGTSPGADGDAPASPEPAQPPADCPGVAQASQNTALQTGSAQEASAGPPQVPSLVPVQVPLQVPLSAPPEMSSANSQNWSRLELRPECDGGANLMLCAVCLGGIVSLSVVVQQPSALFFIGLLLVMRRL